jgi:hypothetical protein
MLNTVSNGTLFSILYTYVLLSCLINGTCGLGFYLFQQAKRERFSYLFNSLSLLTIDIKMKCCNKLTSCLSVGLIWMLIRTFFANAMPRRSLTYWETNIFKKIWNLNVVHIRLFSFHDIYFFFGLRSLEYLVHKKITFKLISCLHYPFLLTNIFTFPPSPKWLIKPKKSNSFDQNINSVNFNSTSQNKCYTDILFK